jgi:hypothetical protein
VGDRRPTSRVEFEDYYEGWTESYAVRTKRGISETSREEYRRTIESHAFPQWRTW